MKFDFTNASLNPALIEKIVSHPGPGHADDFNSYCFLAAVVKMVTSRAVPIEFRVATAADFADARIAVLDQGGRHEPALANFDHHGPEFAEQSVCTMTLLIDALGMIEQYQRCKWLLPLAQIDNLGPQEYAYRAGIKNVETVFALQAPFMSWFNNSFKPKLSVLAADGLITPSGCLYELLIKFGTEALLEHPIKMAARFKEFKTALKIENVGDVLGVINNIPVGTPGDLPPSAGLEEYLIEMCGREPHPYALGVSVRTTAGRA